MGVSAEFLLSFPGVRVMDGTTMKKLFLAATPFFILSVGMNIWADDGQKTLTLDYAKKITTKAEAFAKKKNWKVSIAIVNSEGNLLTFQRDPEAYTGSIEAAMQKARSSNAFQRPTGAFVDGIKQGRMGLLSVHGVVAIEGGVPIVLNGKHVGAIGVSGAKATEDEEAAKAGLE